MNRSGDRTEPSGLLWEGELAHHAHWEEISETSLRNLLNPTRACCHVNGTLLSITEI